MQRVLITGAAGKIGSTLRHGLRGSYQLRLCDVKPAASPEPGEESTLADLTSLDAALDVMHGVDCVVHLAGIPTEAPWEDILPNNISATYNVFEAARRCGTRRVIFASSNHAIGFYRANRTVLPDDPVRPDSRYGVSKVFGEALGRLYSDKHGLAVACLRIGSFRPRPMVARELATWISPRDLTQLVRRCIESPAYRFAVLFGVSANTRARWRNTTDIGYAPEDNAEHYAADVLRAAEPAPAKAFHGGEFTAMEFTNDERLIE
jgi:uronate dehydrogenase